MNLLTETENTLAHRGKTRADVTFICNNGERITTEAFKQAANREYDNGYGYGGVEVSRSLYIVGQNWWLERATYDGSEWWEFKKKPTLPKKVADSARLFE